MIYIGIDPGLDGGIAILRDSIIELHKTPVIGGKDYDIQGMKEILFNLTMARVVAYKPSVANLKMPESVFCTIENQISMPGQGLTSTLQTGKGFGIWLGLLAGLEIPYQVVAAISWQKKLFTGVKGNLDTKAKSEVIAKRLFPTADFRKSERARFANDGLTDAACIAEYGKRTHMVGDPGTGIPHTPLASTQEICSVCGRYIPGDTEGCFK